MKRIVITDEEKKKYEIRAKELQQRSLHKLEERRMRNPNYVRRKKKKQQRQARRKENLKLSQTDFYLSREWRELRYKVLRRFGFSCMACGARPPDVVLHVDHIKPRIKYPELQLNPDNLQVLCEACNVGKRHYFQDDLRPIVKI